MSKTIKMKLSTSSIQQTINKLQELKKELDKADEKIVEELSDLGLEEIQTNYANTFFKDGNDDVNYFQKGSKKKKTIGATGSQVLYNEFGTGTEGAVNSHPKKGEFGLNDYNSGKKIRKASQKISEKEGIPQGEFYWTYKDKGGNTIYTDGIPAGKQVYMAAQKIQKEKEKIIKKVVGDALSKL